VPEFTYYEYSTKAGTVSDTFTAKHTSERPGTMVAGSDLSSGDQFVFDGKIYTYDGGADSGSVGGPELGFFATTKNGHVTFFSGTPLTKNVTYYLNTSQGYNIPPSPPCFVRGTRLTTSAGEVAVEAIKVGDMIATWQDGQTVLRPVRWIGGRSLNLAAHPRPETVMPIRIQRDAFSDNVPCHDLMVSPDHAIFVAGKLVCARQLVNRTTIRQETSLETVQYFHVELDQHSVVFSEGLLSESYLDTGNRGFFSNSDKPTVLHPDLSSEADNPTRETSSCAPFVWDEATVRPIWETLAERAAALGQPAPAHATVTDPELCIIAGGRQLQPLFVETGCYCFMLPTGVTEARVVSRAASPTDERPWLEDRRRLGVYVERIVLRSANDVQEIPVDHPGLAQGWWSVERNGSELRRWTDGDAELPLPVTDPATMLEIHASTSGMTYPARADEQHLAA
jgi:hypothetical protein